VRGKQRPGAPAKGSSAAERLASLRARICAREEARRLPSLSSPSRSSTPAATKRPAAAVAPSGTLLHRRRDAPPPLPPPPLPPQPLRRADTSLDRHLAAKLQREEQDAARFWAQLGVRRQGALRAQEGEAAGEGNVGRSGRLPDTSRDAQVAAELQRQESYGAAAWRQQQQLARRERPVTRSQSQSVMASSSSSSSPACLAVVPYRGGGAMAAAAVAAVPQRASTGIRRSSGSGVPRTVQTQLQQRQISSKPDGSTAEDRTRVRQCKLFDKRGKGPLQKVTQVRNERVRKLRNGKTVVTETVTLKKVSYLR